MTVVPNDTVVVEFAPGGMAADPSTWVWEDITTYVRVADGIQIRQGRQDEASTVGPSSCSLRLDNTAGRFTPQNPEGPYYGRLSKSTPLRVRWGGRSEIVEVTASDTGSGSQAAPSVDAPTANGLLVGCWANVADDGTYALPGSMTAGVETSTTDVMTVRAGWEALTAAGATGTRTATFTGTSDAYLAASILLTGVTADPVLEQEVSGMATGAQTLTTDASTEQGWWLIAVQVSPDASVFDPAVTSPGDAWTLLFTTGENPSDDTPRMRVWARPVTTAGAQTVDFEGGATGSEEHRRVFVVSGLGHVRFTGFVSEWPPRWDLSGNDTTVPIAANGALRRLQQGSPALGSALYRQISGGFREPSGATSSTATLRTPNQYWPLEDDGDATRGASVVDSRHLRPSGDVRFGQAASQAGSAAQVVLGQGASLVGTCRTFLPSVPTIDMQWTFEAWVDFGPASAADPRLEIDVSLGEASYMLYNRIFIEVDDSFLNRSVDVRGRDSDDPTTNYSIVDDVFEPTLDFSGVHHVALRADNVVSLGDDIVRYRLYVDGDEVGVAQYEVFNGMPRQVIVRNASAADVDIGVSHVVLWMRGDEAMGEQMPARYQAGTGYLAETAADRVARLCDEENVPFTHWDPDARSEAMGPQPAATFLDIIRDAETTDGGVLLEHGADLTYRPRVSLYNQAARLALDVDQGHLAAPPEPTDDDQRLRNVVVVDKRGGSSSTAADLSSVEQVGRYEEQVTVNTEEDAQVDRIATWRLHLGSSEELRWPVVPIDLANNDTLIGDWLAFRVGDRVTVDHALPELPGVPVDLIGEGWTETLLPFTWRADLNCSPARPWEVFEVEHDTRGRVGSAGSTLGTGIDPDDTSLSVASDDLRWIDSTNYSAMFPFDIEIGGEQMTVTAITGTSSPQTFTVTRSVNGVTKSHAAGGAVQVYRRTVVAL